MPARETALNVLIACRKEGAWCNGALKQQLARDRLDPRDAALAARMCYGVLQNRNRLDFYLKQLLTGKLRDLRPVVRDILHLGLYQIYDLDKVPDSAAVNESVTLAKKFCKKQRFAPGLVNGVLRNAVRTKGTLKEPVSLEDRYSHPWELIALLRDNVGTEKLEPMLAANNASPATVVQVNTLKTTAEALISRLDSEHIQAQPHPWLENCLILSGTGSLEKSPAFEEGLFYVQDAASRLSVRCAEIPPKADWKILDCCAAPGGKSFAAALTAAGAGKIISCDIYDHKAGLIRSGAERLGIENMEVLVQDASQFRPKWENAMDLVMTDVPCSGYGIIRKKPDIRFKDPKQMETLPRLQLQILANQARYVKPGGVLLYSTCTLLKRENEDVTEAFLQQNPEFYREALSLPKPFPKNEDGMLTLIPGEYDTDGFFICRLRRKS